MKKLSIFASVSAALVCAAAPASFNWSSANVTLVSLDTAEAKVGRPLTATSVAGVSRRVHRREYRRAAAGATVGAAFIGGAAAEPYVEGPAPPPGPAVAGQPLMTGRAMATAQGPTRILSLSTLSREGGAGPNQTVSNGAGRHSGDIGRERDNEPSGRLYSNQLEHIRAHFQRISCKG